MSTCLTCGVRINNGLIGLSLCYKCEDAYNRSRLLHAHFELWERLIKDAVSFREIRWTNTHEIEDRTYLRVRCAVLPADHLRFDRNQGIHGLSHYIETRIVAPMGTIADPDREVFTAYRVFNAEIQNVPLDHVLEEIERHQQIVDDRFFDAVSEIKTNFGLSQSVGQCDKRGVFVCLERDKF